MKFIQSLILILLLPLVGNSQELELVTQLHDTVNETSGLIYLNEKIITHNDSGDDPVLYELDSLSGEVTRRVFISNASNVDWEDLCYDGMYIYIADMGNNNGTRTDLKIYRIPILEYFSTTNDTVVAETIEFSYNDQTSFAPNQFATNFDAEALISWNDSLYIFTKNWGNNWTNIYALPKTVGVHQTHKVDSINSEGLVTGATVNLLTNTIMLSGYTFSGLFVMSISSLNSNAFSSGIINRYTLETPAGFSYQTEGILCMSENQYFLTSEESFSGSSALYKLEFKNTQGLENIQGVLFNVYPNPATDFIHIDYFDLSTVEIYDASGTLQKVSSESLVSVSDLSKGVYYVIVKNSEGDTPLSRKLIIN